MRLRARSRSGSASSERVSASVSCARQWPAWIPVTSTGGWMISASRPHERSTRSATNRLLAANAVRPRRRLRSMRRSGRPGQAAPRDCCRVHRALVPRGTVRACGRRRTSGCGPIESHVMREHVGSDERPFVMVLAGDPPGDRHDRERERLVAAQRCPREPRLAHRPVAVALGSVVPEAKDVSIGEQVGQPVEDALGATGAFDPFGDDQSAHVADPPGARPRGTSSAG